MTELEQDGPKSSAITDHAFVPRGEWWTTCGHEIGRQLRGPMQPSRPIVCGLAEAAHQSTTLTEEDRR